MKILMIANFVRDFSASEINAGRFIYLAKILANNHEVEIITSNFLHGAKKHRVPFVAEYPFKITFLEETGYRKNVCLQRFYSHYKWGRNLKNYLNSIEKPDVVYCAIPSLTGPSYVAEYCQKNNIRFVIDIQDLWPEAFKMVFNMPIVSEFIFWPFKRKADYIYSCADDICAVSDTYVNRALTVNEKLNKGTTVFIGNNLERFDLYSKEKSKISKKNGEIWIAYCGTLGSSYDLICVFDALEILAKERITPKFLIMGGGPRCKEFENYAQGKQINAIFTGFLPYNEMCSLLCQCDIVVNPITHNAAQSITNKHGDYAMSGLPVVSTQENEEYQKLVEEYNMGFNCKNGDSIDMADKLRLLYTNEKLRKMMGLNARRCAQEKFDRRITYRELESIIVK